MGILIVGSVRLKQALSQLVDTWEESNPTHHTIPDDIANMYNNVSLAAVFEAMREHQPKLIAVTRLIYGLAELN